LLGGVAQLHEHAHERVGELEIALAGPAASFVIGAVSGIIALGLYGIGAPGVFTAAFVWLSVVSILLAVFNLLPGAPLDGGRVLAAILWRRSGDERGSRQRAAEVGYVMGQVLIGLGVVEVFFGGDVSGLWLALLGWILMGAARGESAQLQLTGALTGVRVADVMTRDPRVVRSGTTVAQFVEDSSGLSRGSTFPIVDAQGRLAGLVTFRSVRSLPSPRWPTTTVDEIAIPHSELWTAAPDEYLVDALTRGHRGEGRIVVVDNARVIGMVSPIDVTQAMQRFGLRADLTSPRP
jgi:CBS domain-containing protein